MLEHLAFQFSQGSSALFAPVLAILACIALLFGLI
jgi:hypothetical protein